MDIGAGRVGFGEDLSYGIQLLGTETEGGNWLWAWANLESQLPPEVLQAVEPLRAIGEERGVEELCTPSFDLPEGREGHHLALVASKVLGGHLYYRGPYPGGALYFLIVGIDAAKLEAARPRALLPGTIAQAVSAFELDHELLARTLLEARGFEVSEEAAARAPCSSSELRCARRFESCGDAAISSRRLSSASYQKPCEA